MVKFQVRSMRKHYKKNKEYTYIRYSIEFPATLNKKIEPHINKDFDGIEINYKENNKQEILNITLTRNKTDEQTDKWNRPPQ